MKISLIVAMASNRVIGINNTLPWHLSADLKNFKKITMGKPMLMGRKTHESIGKALPGRKNIILSRNVNYRQENCVVYHSIERALSACENDAEVMIIGGDSFYRVMLAKAQRIYLTQIHQDFMGDSYFPELDRSVWKERERTDITDDTSTDFDYSFIVLERL